MSLLKYTPLSMFPAGAVAVPPTLRRLDDAAWLDCMMNTGISAGTVPVTSFITAMPYPILLT